MEFQYKESKLGGPMLAIKTNQHVDIEFLFDKGEYPSYVYINNHEFSASDDTFHGLFVGIGEKVISIRELLLQAVIDYPVIKLEVAQEASEAAAHEREMSCPRATGRI